MQGGGGAVACYHEFSAKQLHCTGNSRGRKQAKIQVMVAGRYFNMIELHAWLVVISFTAQSVMDLLTLNSLDDSLALSELVNDGNYWWWGAHLQ